MDRLKLPDLPITSIIPELLRELDRATLIAVDAPPGTGKSTIVPLAMLERGWGRRGLILMLQPRRVAARAVAARMASILGERVGRTVGYRVRMESKVSERTRILVVTEAILTRMLQDDPSLEAISAVLFDEFHERSLNTDLGLTLSLDVQRSLRPDLRILLMSATLDQVVLNGGIGDVSVITTASIAHPVEIRYEPPRAEHRLEDEIREAIVRAWNATAQGTARDILVFLPGEREIRRIERDISDALPHDASVHALYGSLSLEEQSAALVPRDDGRRKVILATNIAETSLTIEGVGVVVDSGLVRRPRYSPDTGAEVLETVKISRSSATQRAGRAGRLGPGVCVRLWSRLVDEHLEEDDPPEIRHADLTRIALEIACWGERDPWMLPWPEPPPEPPFQAARRVLRLMGAIDHDGIATAIGRAMARFPAHPRISNMVLSAAPASRPLAVRLGAVLSEPDLLRSPRFRDEPDIRSRMDVLANTDRPRGLTGRQIDRLRAVADRFSLEAAGATDDSADRNQSGASAEVGALLLESYPDRVAIRIGPARYRLITGEIVSLREGSTLSTETLVVVETGGAAASRHIRLAAPVSRETIERRFETSIEEHEHVYWDGESERVMTRRTRELGALVLTEVIAPSASRQDAEATILALIRDRGLSILPWTNESRSLLERLRFAALWDERFPDASDATLLETMESWLAPFLTSRLDRQPFRSVDLVSALGAYAGWDTVDRLRDVAPERVVVPSGASLRVDYSDPSRPTLAVRMQEMFGSSTGPVVGRDEVPVTLHLLSPAGRPLQITQDLGSFWRHGYAEVRKEMRGRYPKHFWPEDPMEASPTRGLKPR